jgi:hypothetical protein
VTRITDYGLQACEKNTSREVSPAWRRGPNKGWGVK